MRLKNGLFTAFISIQAVVISAPLFPEKLPEEISGQAQERIDKGYHLGTVIGVIDKQGARYYGFGQMSLSNQSKPDEKAIFEIGSITKTFTATLLADLDLHGKLGVEDSVENHIPIFKKVQGSGQARITLEHLATHTSGLPREPLNMNADDDDRYKTYSAEHLHDFLSTFSLDSNQTAYRYSNLGVLVLEHAIESTMATDYESLVTEKICHVLKMSDTYFEVPQDKKHRLVIGYRHGRETQAVDVGQFPAMGGIRTTAIDMVRFLGAQLGLIPSSLNAVMRITNKERYADDEVAMGLGWQILKRPESGKVLHFHKGGTNGFVSFAGFNLEDQIGVIVLVNGRNYFSDLGFNILDASYPVKTNIPPGNYR